MIADRFDPGGKERPTVLLREMSIDWVQRWFPTYVQNISSEAALIKMFDDMADVIHLLRKKGLY